MAEEGSAEDPADGSEILDTANTINEMSSKGWMSDLLGPAAKVFGKSLGAWAQDIVDGKKLNVHTHIDEVTRHNPKLSLPATPAAAKRFEEWLTGAAEAEPETPEASLWQSLLEDIMKDGGANEAYLIGLAKQISKKDLLTISRVEKGKSIENIYAEKLEKIGLLIVKNNYLYGLTLVVNIILLYAFYNIIFLGTQENIEIQADRLFSASSFYQLIIPFTSVFLISIALVSSWEDFNNSSHINRPRKNTTLAFFYDTRASLTPTGREILKKTLKYAPKSFHENG